MTHVDERPLDALLDTSVFVAQESGRTLNAGLLPQRGFVSAITLAELEAGVLAATEVGARAQRLRTLTGITGVEVLAIDAAAAHHWARLRVALQQEGRRINVNDLWIAAVALAHDLPVVTQDADFDPLAELGELRVIRV